MRYIAFLLPIALFFAACSENKKPGQTLSETQAQESRDQLSHHDRPELTQTPDVTLSGKIYKKHIDSESYFVVLNIDGNEQIIDTVMACETIAPSDYAQYDIPKKAVAACGGWWAGAGDYFYAVAKNGKVSVYQGWQDEAQEDDGYHWKKMDIE